jgi:subtilisin-like proprotein convertase family protein
MRSSRKRRVGLATLVLALAAALAYSVPGVTARVKQGPPKPKAVNKIQNANAPIPVASPGPPFTSTRTTSSITVANKKKFNWLIRDVNVDLYLTVPPGSNTDDLRILLNGPNGAVMTLSGFNGSVDATGFGTSCNGGATLFDDQSSKLFMASSAFDPATDDPNTEEFIARPPYIGKVSPDGTLRVFNNFKIKGTWTLIVINSSTSETGTLLCWSLHGKPIKVGKHEHT